MIFTLVVLFMVASPFDEVAVVELVEPTELPEFPKVHAVVTSNDAIKMLEMNFFISFLLFSFILCKAF